MSDRAARTIQTKLDGWYADVNADYEFALGPGRLKLIGLQHRDHEPRHHDAGHCVSTDGADPIGVRFSRDSIIGETIGRGEYHWKTGKNDWQVTFERAFNSLDQKGGLFILNPTANSRKSPSPKAPARSRKSVTKASPRSAGR